MSFLGIAYEDKKLIEADIDVLKNNHIIKVSVPDLLTFAWMPIEIIEK